ncbi:hypothetical protein WME94_32445 [Sorangium sp. So ce429]
MRSLRLCPLRLHLLCLRQLVAAPTALMLTFQVDVRGNRGEPLYCGR